MTEMTTGTELRHLPLAARHRSEGAGMMPLCGWEVPASFGDPEGEYVSAREKVALLDASFLTVVGAEGKDHLEYLNRRLSQYVIALQPGEGRHAAQLNADGRMEAELELFRANEALSWLVAPPAVSGPYLQALAEKYVFSEDARFTDQSGGWNCFALLGPLATSIVGAGRVEGTTVRAVEIEGVGCHVLRSHFLPGAIVVAVPARNAAGAYEYLHALVRAARGGSMGFLAFDTIRVEAGVPWWGIDLTDRSIPLEADLMTAIHTNKGCYPGQETIAKIINLGHPARKLVGVVWNGEDPPSADAPLLVDGKEVGRLSSSTYTPVLQKAIGLATVKWQYRDAGTVVYSSDGLEGRLTTLPFPHVSPA